LLVCCFIAPDGHGALTRDTEGRNLPEDYRPWTFCRHVELAAGKDDAAAIRLIRYQGYCLFRYPAEQGTAARRAAGETNRQAGRA
jgi:hypothetical protein